MGGKLAADKSLPEKILQGLIQLTPFCSWHTIWNYQINDKIPRIKVAKRDKDSMSIREGAMIFLSYSSQILHLPLFRNGNPSLIPNGQA